MANKYLYIKANDSANLVDKYIMGDISKLDNVEMITLEKKNIKNVFLKILQKIHLSYKISKIIKLPLKWIWYDFKKLNINKNDNYYILVPTGAFWEYSKSAISGFHKFKNVKLVLLIFDTIGVNTPSGRLINTLYKSKMWDHILTYDPNDAKKYGFTCIGETYYSKPENDEVEVVNSDAYFIGGLKPGRVDEVINLFDYLHKNGVNVKFDVVKNDGMDLNYKEEGFNVLEQRKLYSYALEQTKKTNCIIEFLQTGQHAQSLRYFEAVCYNKKLLTNNENVKNLSFYNEKYMKIFNKLEDIDTEWVKKKENINYNYNGEFSPIHILKIIEEIDKK